MKEEQPVIEEEDTIDEEPPTIGIGGKLKEILENWFSDDIN